MCKIATLICTLGIGLVATQCKTPEPADMESFDPSGAKHVEINLATQNGELIQGDCVLAVFPVCTGTKRKPTPTGDFRIIGKDRHHESNLYPNSPMPYFMRLTNGGIGLHQGPMEKVPSSHGCIRLHKGTAQYLFKECPIGTRVKIVRRDPPPPPAPEDKDKKKH